MNTDPVKQAWQASVEIAGAPPLEEVRKGANKFYRFIWWRNAVEYVACVIVVASFGYYVFTLPHVLQKIGSVLVIAAALYAPWQLHRRASAEPPEKAGAMPIYNFLRAQLVRQREALRGIFWWYILPFIPGMVLIVVGKMLSLPAGPARPQWIGLAVMVALLAGIWWLNQLAARKLQRRIDEIDALTGRVE
jgi:hypothetical protein